MTLRLSYGDRELSVLGAAGLDALARLECAAEPFLDSPLQQPLVVLFPVAVDRDRDRFCCDPHVFDRLEVLAVPVLFLDQLWCSGVTDFRDER